jgi:putative ABC transport system substrate-binding protein
VQIGLVASMNRPGGNVTGATGLGVSKRLELAHELVPTATVIAALINPANTTQAEPQLRDLQAAARTLGLKLHAVHASTERDFGTVFATLVRLRPGALVIGIDGFLIAGINSSSPCRFSTRCP